MVDVMIAAMPFHGHVAPMSAVARAFIAQGHTVRVYTGNAHAARFEELGASVIRWQAAPDFDEQDLSATFPVLRGRKGPRQMLANVEQVFVRTGSAQCADLLAAFDEHPWEVIVADGMSLGAHLAAERTSTAWVTVSIVPLMVPTAELPPPGLGLRPARGALGRVRDRLLHRVVALVGRPINRAYQAERVRVGLAPNGLGFDAACTSPQLVCASGVRELEYPRDRPIEQVVHVGELIGPSSDDRRVPGRWEALERDGAPIVHVTQGTLNVDPHDLIEPSFSALGRQPVRIVAATGRDGDDALPFPAPPNASVADFVPYDRLLPRTDTMITNGGWGGVLAALAHDVPLIIAGGDVDKPEIAARVAYAGAGIDLRTGRPKPRAILRAWRAVSADASFRTRAARIGAALRAHDGPREVVEHTLDLLEARRSS
ncbi:hypothetical protein ASE14_03515 [Agromyces sp. Root81]|uniref:glycosyltransferase n=1 Tax=Agromyces sp. Root81 TaxID=1736601 RepID=UPI0006FC7E21|nr:nucleotide disphospho-sugar-binding domain-containing protein [Agromyces sp. Root81]KRC62888.1 hypothetical protein ASE14_03515 [Agromyces sp. Root81]